MECTVVTGIDTDIGKTFVTGLVAKYLFEKGDKITTFKVVQTGNDSLSEDIVVHREIMGVALDKEDQEGLTCPELFKFPASPHLAAKLENRRVSTENINNALIKLSTKYEKMIIEGVGGIFVPLYDTYTLVDYIEDQKFPCIVVSTPKLGSINHTLMTLDILKNRGIKVKGLVYNLSIDEKREIREDSKSIFNTFHPEIPIVEVPFFELDSPPKIDFSSFKLWENNEKIC